MKVRPPFSFVEDRTAKPEDGAVFPITSICRKAATEKCVTHYQTIVNTSGFHVCPYGFTSYVSGDANEPILTAMRILGRCDNKRLKGRLGDDFCPTMTEPTFIRTLAEFRSQKQEYEQSSEAAQKSTFGFINETIHEIRKLNRAIKAFSEAKIYSPEQMLSIYQSSSLISNRLALYDYEANPQSSRLQRRSGIRIYKKFDKIAHILAGECTTKDVSIKLVNPTGRDGEIEGFEIFDMLPFLLLENAIKFSNRKDQIIVEFTNDGTAMLILVRSWGPILAESEHDKAFGRGYRGQNASSKEGTGFGLYFAKKICDMHRIEISVGSDVSCSKQLENIARAPFEVRLRFTKVAWKTPKQKTAF